MPLVSRTRATLRSAEFGFFGVWVKTRTQTPRFCGLFCNAGLFVLLTIFFRPSRTSWLMVGINLKKKGARPFAGAERRKQGRHRGRLRGADGSRRGPSTGVASGLEA